MSYLTLEETVEENGMKTMKDAKFLAEVLAQSKYSKKLAWNKWERVTEIGMGRK